MPPLDIATMSPGALRYQKRLLTISARRNEEMSNEYARAAKNDLVRLGHIENRLKELKEIADDRR